MTTRSPMPIRDVIAQALSVHPDTIASMDFAVRSYTADDLISAEGVADDNAYVVLSGSLRVATMDAQHKFVTIARHEAGALVG